MALSWLPPSSNGGAPVDRYLIYRATAASGPFTALAQVTGTSFTFNGLTGGIRFYFRVFAHNAAGWSPMSNTVSAVPVAAPGVPSAPRALFAAPGNGRVTLTWQPHSSTGGPAVSTYTVQRTSGSAWVTVSTTVPGSASSYTVTGLANGTAYQFRIFARNTYGQSPQSSWVTATPLAVPSAPRSLTARSGDHSVTLSWQAPASSGATPITGYLVQRWTGSTFVNEASLGPTARTHRVTGLTNDVRYAFRVLARNSRGWSPPSNGAAAYALDPRPAAPVPISYPPPRVEVDVATLIASATLEWVHPSVEAVSHFIVQRSTDGATWTSATIAPTGPYGESYRDTGLAVDTVYHYRVAGVNEFGQGPWSTTVTVRTPTRCPDRAVPGYDGNVLVTLSFQAGFSCADAPREQDAKADKEVTWDPASGWGCPGCTVLENCPHELFGQTAATTSVRYTCWGSDIDPPRFWFVITYPRDVVPYWG